jgi:hypothetical protein
MGQVNGTILSSNPVFELGKVHRPGQLTGHRPVKLSQALSPFQVIQAPNGTTEAFWLGEGSIGHPAVKCRPGDAITPQHVFNVLPRFFQKSSPKGFYLSGERVQSDLLSCHSRLQFAAPVFGIKAKQVL